MAAVFTSIGLLSLGGCLPAIHLRLVLLVIGQGASDRSLSRPSLSSSSGPTAEEQQERHRRLKQHLLTVADEQACVMGARRDFLALALRRLRWGMGRALGAPGPQLLLRDDTPQAEVGEEEEGRTGSSVSHEGDEEEQQSISRRRRRKKKKKQGGAGGAQAPQQREHEEEVGEAGLGRC